MNNSNEINLPPENKLILNINKPIGLTSYDVIRQLKKKYPGQKIGHAGTLDPLADGVLIVLVGSKATKMQSEFMNVDKEYVFDVLFGIKTDTYDVLGFSSEVVSYDADDISSKLETALVPFSGEIVQKVPPFSAVKVEGRPLYRWYLDGKIDQVEIPQKEITVESISLEDTRLISKDDLFEQVNSLVNTVRSGFRQKEVLLKWEKVFQEIEQEQFLAATVRAKVSKGTYVRAIAHELGKSLGVGACTLTITRTRVGDFKIEDADDIEK